MAEVVAGAFAGAFAPAADAAGELVRLRGLLHGVQSGRSVSGDMEGDGSDLEPPDAGDDSKSENGENAPIYCICRKPDINCFMIGCDNCNEWFHGDCIRITEKMAKAIREWYCRECRAPPPTAAAAAAANQTISSDVW